MHKVTNTTVNLGKKLFIPYSFLKNLNLTPETIIKPR